MTTPGAFDPSVLLRGIRDVADFPLPGVLFRDLAPVLADPAGLAAVVEGLAAQAPPVDTVVGIEARGFALAAAVAYRLGAGFVPVRKAGKLPGPTLTASYDLEYGSAVLEVQRSAFDGAERVLVVDDVLATGGTAAAALGLLARAGGGVTVAAVGVIVELAALGGRAALAAGYPDVPVQALLRL